jgi:hypothetical protein
MRVMLWLLVSILAAPFAAGASAQEINWEKADAAFGRKPAVSGDVHRLAQNRTGAERGSSGYRQVLLPGVGWPTIGLCVQAAPWVAPATNATLTGLPESQNQDSE